MSLLALIRIVPRWAYYLLIFVGIAFGLMRAHVALTNKALEAERQRVTVLNQKNVIEAQNKAGLLTADNAAKTAALDNKFYKDYENAQKTADYWRTRAISERVPSRTKAANCAEAVTSGGMGDDAAAVTIDTRQIDVSSAAIIELSTVAGQMRAQVEYLQAKVKADRVTIDGSGDDK